MTIKDKPELFKILYRQRIIEEKSVTELAAIHGVSKQTITNWLKSYNISFKSFARRRPSYRRNESLRLRAIQLFKDGMSITDVAGALKITESVVRRMINDHEKNQT